MDQINDSITDTPAADSTATTEAEAPAETTSNFVPLTTSEAGEAKEKYNQFLPIIVKRGGPKPFFKDMIEANVPRDGKTTFVNKRVEPPITEEVAAVTLDAFMAFWRDWYVKTDPIGRKGLRYDGEPELVCGLNLGHKEGRVFPNLRWVITTGKGEVVLDRDSAIEPKDQKPLYEGSYVLIKESKVPTCPSCKRALRDAHQKRYDAKKAALSEGQRPPRFEHVRFYTKTDADKILSAAKMATARKEAVATAAAKTLGTLTKAPERKPNFGRKDRGKR